MHALVGTVAAGGIANRPPHRVTGRNSAERFSGLEGDIADLTWRCVEAVKSAFAVLIELDRIQISALGWLL